MFDLIYLFINVLIYVIVFNEGTKLEWFLHKKDLMQLTIKIINAINKTERIEVWKIRKDINNFVNNL